MRGPHSTARVQQTSPCERCRCRPLFDRRAGPIALAGDPMQRCRFTYSHAAASTSAAKVSTTQREREIACDTQTRTNTSLAWPSIGHRAYPMTQELVLVVPRWCASARPWPTAGPLSLQKPAVPQSRSFCTAWHDVPLQAAPLNSGTLRIMITQHATFTALAATGDHR